MHYCDDVEISTETRDDEQYHERITGVLRSSRSDTEWKFTGEVMDLIPLRNRRQDPDGNWLMTRISEGMTQVDRRSPASSRARSATASASTSTRSSTAQPVGSPSSRRLPSRDRGATTQSSGL